MKLEDIGTRYEHYRELLDLWEQGYEILVQKKTELNGFVSTELITLMIYLKGAIELMTKQLEIQSQMEVNMYRLRDTIETMFSQKQLTEGDKK